MRDGDTYPDRDNYVCADCGHEWPIAAVAQAADAGLVVKPMAMLSTAATR